MIKIMIERSQLFHIGIKERCTEKFSETAYLLEEGFSVWGVLTTAGDGEVNKFLHAFEGSLSIVCPTFGEPFCGTIAFTADVGHLLGKRHIGPSSVTEGFMLHGYSTNDHINKGIGSQFLELYS